MTKEGFDAIVLRGYKAGFPLPLFSSAFAYSMMSLLILLTRNQCSVSITQVTVNVCDLLLNS